MVFAYSLPSTKWICFFHIVPLIFLIFRTLLSAIRIFSQRGSKFALVSGFRNKILSHHGQTRQNLISKLHYPRVVYRLHLYKAVKRLISTKTNIFLWKNYFSIALNKTLKMANWMKNSLHLCWIRMHVGKNMCYLHVCAMLSCMLAHYALFKFLMELRTA